MNTDINVTRKITDTQLLRIARKNEYHGRDVCEASAYIECIESILLFPDYVDAWTAKFRNADQRFIFEIMYSECLR